MGLILKNSRIIILNNNIKGLENVINFNREFSTPSKKKAEQDQKLNSQLEACLNILKPKPKVKINYTPEELEEGARRAKEYSRLKMKQHREWQSDMTTKEMLTRAAIYALPPHLRTEAVKEDETPVPSNLPFPTDTPPDRWQ